MPRFACPHCKTVHKAEDSARGLVLACSKCARKIRVPAGKSVSAGKSRPARPASDRAASPPPKRRPTPTPAAPDDDVDVIEEIEEVADDADTAPKSAPTKVSKKAKSSSAMTNAVGSAGGILTLIVFLLIVTGRWESIVAEPLKDYFTSLGVPPIVAPILVGAVLLGMIGLWFLLTVKSAILGAIPNDIEFRATKPSEFENLDHDMLVELTTQFTTLGFQKQQDYTLDSDVSKTGGGFGRLFLHPKHQVWGEINQVFRKSGQAVPMRINLASFLADDWSVSTGNRQPSKEGYLMRRPRAVWRSLPDTDLPELLDAHLKLRQKMEQDLGAGVLRESTAKAFFTHEKAANRERKEAVRRRWAISIMLEFWLFDRAPKKEWLGDYARKQS